MDAELRDESGAAAVTLLLYYNGAPAYQRRWDSRALALEDAARKRLELEREGWIPHW